MSANRAMEYHCVITLGQEPKPFNPSLLSKIRGICNQQGLLLSEESATGERFWFCSETPHVTINHKTNLPSVKLATEISISLDKAFESISEKPLYSFRTIRNNKRVMFTVKTLWDHLRKEMAMDTACNLVINIGLLDPNPSQIYTSAPEYDKALEMMRRVIMFINQN